MRPVAVVASKSSLSELLHTVERDEEIVIARHGNPVTGIGQCESRVRDS